MGYYPFQSGNDPNVPKNTYSATEEDISAYSTHFWEYQLYFLNQS